jgi:hypothetical protein
MCRVQVASPFLDKDFQVGFFKFLFPVIVFLRAVFLDEKTVDGD